MADTTTLRDVALQYETGDTPAATAALVALAYAEEWPTNDASRDSALTHAMVFATLAVADAINAAGENGPGYTLAQAMLIAGGVQP